VVASLPVTSLVAVVWLWRVSGDWVMVGVLAAGAWWFVLRSVRVFVVLPMLLRSGLAFWAAMAIVVAGTLALYALMFWAGPRLGLKV
jgi:hypothetical protein